jgi:hypothetical protein
MRAEITYNDGKSYTVKGKRFECGITRMVDDAALIKHCSETQGFAVRILKEKKIIQVEPQVEEHEEAHEHDRIRVAKKIRTVRDE